MKNTWLLAGLPTLASLSIFTVAPMHSPFAVAADGWEIGLRATVVTAGGEPANDIPSAGLFLRTALSKDYLLGFALDRANHDFESPASTVGLSQDPALKTIDSTVSSTVISVWLERLFGSPEATSRWFVTAGLGLARPDVKDASGPLAGGGTFNITTDAGSEAIVSFGAGWRRRLGTNWSGEVALRADHHFADWKVTDRVSGQTGTIDDYTGVGAHLGLSYRF